MLCHHVSYILARGRKAIDSQHAHDTPGSAGSKKDKDGCLERRGTGCVGWKAAREGRWDIEQRPAVVKQANGEIHLHYVLLCW